MRLTALLLVIAFSIQSASADQLDSRYGKYLCITDRSVGFQTPENGGARFAGSIRMPPEQQKFFVTLRKVQKVARNEPQYQHGLLRHSPERCFSQEGMDAIEKRWEAGGDDSKGIGLREYALWCLAVDSLEVSAGEFPQYFYSLDQGTFIRNGQPDLIQFGVKTFMWMITDLLGNHYMLEGRCELIK
jgi:hypothetical protein